MIVLFSVKIFVHVEFWWAGGGLGGYFYVDSRFSCLYPARLPDIFNSGGSLKKNKNKNSKKRICLPA